MDLPARDDVGPCVVRQLYTVVTKFLQTVSTVRTSRDRKIDDVPSGTISDTTWNQPVPNHLPLGLDLEFLLPARPGTKTTRYGQGPTAAAPTRFGITCTAAVAWPHGDRGPTEVSKHHDVIVVGGGIIGLAIAWRAAQSGRLVAVVDPDPGQGATWAAAGMLAPVSEAHFGEEALAALNLAAAASWPDFAAQLQASSGMAVHFRSDGTLLVAGDPSDRVAIDRTLAFYRAIDLPAVRLRARSCREAEPMLAPGISGGVELPEDHQVDNRAVATALIEACRAAGVTMVADRVVRVEVDGQPNHELQVQGVTLEFGDALAAPSVVISAGSKSGEVDGLPQAWRPPVRPVHGVTVRLQARRGVPRLGRTVRALVHGRSCYMVPRDDGGLVLGATMEERGSALDVPLGGLTDLLADARRIVPALDEYSVIELTPGLRPGSPDNGPIVGTTAVHGLLLATGHYRNGVLLAPATADEVVALLDTQDDRTTVGPSPFDAFRPVRFTEQEAHG
jgi:glycine oxidase